MAKIKFKSDEEYLTHFEGLIDSLRHIALDYGYCAYGLSYKDCSGRTVISLDYYDVKLDSMVSWDLVKEIGVAVRRFKNKEVLLFRGETVITHKQIKYLKEIELQAILDGGLVFAHAPGQSGRVSSLNVLCRQLHA